MRFQAFSDHGLAISGHGTDRESQMLFADRLCTTFEEYESDPAVFDQVRRELLESF